jgi:phospholipid/cholesterol/gamma-HCH transport system permease protein
MEQVLRESEKAKGKGAEWRLDCSGLKILDSHGIAFFHLMRRRADDLGTQLTLVSLPPALAPRLLSIRPGTSEISARPKLGIFERLGGTAEQVIGEAKGMLLLFSESLYASTFGAFGKKTLLPEDILTQMVRLGSSALPIVLMLSTLIGFTLSLQSGIQLQKFGATLFLADGIGVSMITEIGPVLTAVIMAGRSGSAVTAEISTMVVQEEVGALQAMGVNPIHFLVLPRFWALSVTLPLLTVLACIAGIGAGLLVAFLFFDLSIMAFLGQLKRAVQIEYVFQSLIKSLTFSWVIALVSIRRGLQVRGGADAVGKATTQSVVTCISLIILADAAFSFVFYV